MNCDCLIDVTKLKIAIKMSVPTFKHCIICFKEDKNNSDTNNKDTPQQPLDSSKNGFNSRYPKISENSELCQRFGVLASRLYNLDQDYFKSHKTLKSKFMFHCGTICKSCYPILASFCDIVRTIEYLQMQLDWRAQEIATIMKKANTEGENIACRNVLKEKLADMDGALEELDKFRNDLIENIDERKMNLLPWLLIQKVEEIKLRDVDPLQRKFLEKLKLPPAKQKETITDTSTDSQNPINSDQVIPFNKEIAKHDHLKTSCPPRAKKRTRRLSSSSSSSSSASSIFIPYVSIKKAKTSSTANDLNQKLDTIISNVNKQNENIENSNVDECEDDGAPMSMMNQEKTISPSDLDLDFSDIDLTKMYDIIDEIGLSRTDSNFDEKNENNLTTEAVPAESGSIKIDDSVLTSNVTDDENSKADESRTSPEIEISNLDDNENDMSGQKSSSNRSEDTNSKSQAENQTKPIKKRFKCIFPTCGRRFPSFEKFVHHQNCTGHRFDAEVITYYKK